MKPTIKRLVESLNSTTDGVVACDAIKGLGKHAQKGDADARATLAEYIHGGKVEHMRDFACSCLANLVDESDREFADVFMHGLADERVRFWSILGCINTLGRKAYGELTKIASDESISVEERAQAVKCLAGCSKQTFDRQLPADPGEWEATDLRIDEITAWAEAGYPDGTGYPVPTRHRTLDKPKTSLDRIASRLDKRLAKKRSERQDLADPTNWLAVADDSDVDQITKRWKLPSVYLDFLTRFSPVKVSIDSRRFWNGGLQLFGAGELIDAQEGYAFDPVKKKKLRGWPKDYVVIASHGGDPFVLDLSSSDGKEAPVLTAEHGTGKWNFDEVAATFEAFLRSLAK